MDNKFSSLLNAINFSKNNNLLFEMTNKIKKVIEDLNNNKDKNIIINQLK